IGVVHETRAAGARLAFDLAVLVAEIVAAMGRVALEAFGSLTKALGRGPVSLQLGHRLDSSLCSPVRRLPVGTRCGRTRVLSPACRLRALLLFRCKHHDHLLAFHERVLLDHRVRGQISTDPIEELAPEVLVHHLAAAEPQGDLGLVALREEAGQVTQLDLVIRLSRAGTKFHFLDLNLLLLALSGVRSEEHTSELQSPYDLVCRLLLEKEKTK